MRRSLILLVATIGLLAACSDSKKLTCSDSVAHACTMRGDCVLTWAEAQNDTVFCSSAATFPPSRADCDGYHVVSVTLTDASGSYYYDAATGTLVAIVWAGTGGTFCFAGPSAGFTRPTCSGPASEPLPQCLDGGTADAGTD